MRLLKATEELYRLLNPLLQFNFLKDVNNDWVISGTVIDQADFEPYWSQMEAIDSTIDQELTDIARAKEQVKFRITELAYGGSRFKNHKAIDFKIEVPNLIDDRTFNTLTGLPNKEVWYNAIDVNGVLSDEVLKVEDFDWTFLEDSTIPAARTVTRSSEWQKYKATNTEDIHITDIDGNVIQSVTFTDGYPDDPSFHREVVKHYRTQKQRREVGIKRRSNLISYLEGYLFQNELATGKSQATIITNLTNLFNSYQQQISVYKESGSEHTGDIYSSLEADATDWFQPYKLDAANILRGIAI